MMPCIGHGYFQVTSVTLNSMKLKEKEVEGEDLLFVDLSWEAG